jgi:hypothetical protein
MTSITNGVAFAVVSNSKPARRIDDYLRWTRHGGQRNAAGQSQSTFQHFAAARLQNRTNHSRQLNRPILAQQSTHFAPPCSFTYWPHRGVLVDTDTDVGVLDILLYRFTAARVVQVSQVIGEALDLRLAALVPSQDVIGALGESLQWSIFCPIVVMLGVCKAFIETSSTQTTNQLECTRSTT